MSTKNIISPNTFSVIIPTLNEADRIAKNIRRVRELSGEAEVIVVDGGSADNTVQLAKISGARVIQSTGGRGQQLNSGAKQARGNIFLFLHADSLLPEEAFRLISEIFADDQLQIGTFRLGFDHPHYLLRIYGAFTRLDSLFTRFGDQCIVIRRSFYEELGGFPNWPLFEDVHLLRLARKHTRIVSFPATVRTSARRFLELGIVRTQLLNGWYILQYLRGVSPYKLATQYHYHRNKMLKKYCPGMKKTLTH